MVMSWLAGWLAGWLTGWLQASWFSAGQCSDTPQSRTDLLLLLLLPCTNPAEPFTFDGFGFGAGGWFPGGGLFDGFATNIYNIVFRDILNTGLTEYVARALPNDLGNPLNFIPPDVAGFPLGSRLGRDVVSVFGFDWFDR